MPLRKTVAMERRVDLASLFCLIARHGPAVLLTLLVIGCSLAGFIMFRNMRQKRRRRAESGAERRDSRTGQAVGFGDEGEEPCAPGEEGAPRRGSTDNEEHDNRPNVRHRRASPERIPHRDKLPARDTVEDKTLSSFFWHRFSPKATESHVEETKYNLENNFSHTSNEDVIDEVCDAEEPGPTNDAVYTEQEKVFEADSSEDITSTTEGFSDEESTQEEEIVQFTSNSHLCSAPTVTFAANDGKDDADNSEKTDTQKHELENNIAPVLKQNDITPTSLLTHEAVLSDLIHNPPEDLSPQSGEPDAVNHLDNVPQADILCSDNTVSTAEVMEDSEATHNETNESEPLMRVDTNFDLAATTDIIVAADLSSNFEKQTEPQMTPTVDVAIDQNEFCPQKLSDFESDVDKRFNSKDNEFLNTDNSEATFVTGNVSCVKAMTDSSDISVTDFDEHQQTITTAENISSTFSVEVNEKDSVGPDQVEISEKESFSHVVTKDDGSQMATTDITVVQAELSLNCNEQSEPLNFQTLDTGNDQEQLCPKELSEIKNDADTSFDQKDIGLSNMKNIKTTCDDNATIVEAVSDSLEVTVEECKVDDQQETIGKVDAEITSIGQGEQRQEILPIAQEDDRVYTNNSDDQKESNVVEQEISTICEENIVPEQKDQEDNSLHVDSKQRECSVKPSALHEEIEEETSLSGLSSIAIEEISTVTDTTVQTNDEKRLEGTPDLDTINTVTLSLPSEISEGISNQTSDKDEQMGTSNISACARDKIESMVEEMVAKIYKDVTEGAIKAKPTQVEKNDSLELAQNNESSSSDNLTSIEVESKFITNKMEISKDVNLDSCDTVAKEEDDSQNDCVCVARNASENYCLNTGFNDVEVPADEAGSYTKEIIPLEKETAMCLENVENNFSGPTDSVHQIAIDVKCELPKQNVSLEHVDKVLVQPMDIDNNISDNLTNEPLVHVVEQTHPINVCSNLVAPVNIDSSIVSGLQMQDIVEKNEEEILSGSEKEILEAASTSYQCKQEEFLEFDNGLSDKGLEQVEFIQEIPSGLETEVLEITETLQEVQNDQKEPGILLDIGNNLSGMTAKGGKVVIVCRTLETSISTTEMSDEEMELDAETFSLERTTNIESCQSHINALPANEDVVAANFAMGCTDTLAALTVIEGNTPEAKQSTKSEKQFDLTGHTALDIPQDSSESMESTKLLELKDTCASPQSLESGILNMAVCSKEREGRTVTGQDTLTTCQMYAEENKSCGFTSDSIVKVIKEESEMEIAPLQALIHEDPNEELSMTNEDSFGSEIEEDYRKATEEIMTQVVDDLISENMTKESDKPDKKDTACANKEKVDSGKTEISIMEATMDHNEWITDGNYQVLPWMTTASISKDSISNKETKDITECKAQLLSADESVESSKKVLAVQPMPQNVDVTFRIHYVTLSPYQTVAVTGDQPELGAWKSVVPLVKSKDGYWTCVVSLPAESHVEWKFVVLEKGEVCRWEECGNRLLYTGYGDDLLVHKWWGFL